MIFEKYISMYVLLHTMKIINKLIEHKYVFIGFTLGWNFVALFHPYPVFDSGMTLFFLFCFLILRTFEDLKRERGGRVE